MPSRAKRPPRPTASKRAPACAGGHTGVPKTTQTGTSPTGRSGRSPAYPAEARPPEAAAKGRRPCGSALGQAVRRRAGSGRGGQSKQASGLPPRGQGVRPAGEAAEGKAATRRRRRR